MQQLMEGGGRIILKRKSPKISCHGLMGHTTALDAGSVLV
jgi:hypothetical protein